MKARAPALLLGLALSLAAGGTLSQSPPASSGTGPFPSGLLLDSLANGMPARVCAPETGLPQCLALTAGQCQARARKAAGECKDELAAAMPFFLWSFDEHATWGQRFAQCHGRRVMAGADLLAVDKCLLRFEERKAAVALHADLIARRIRTRIHRPPGVPPDAEVVYEVTLARDGEVAAVERVSGSGDAAYEAAIAKAIRSAAPFKVPSDQEEFETFRTLRLAFRAGPDAHVDPPVEVIPRSAIPEKPADAARRKFVSRNAAYPFKPYVDTVLERIIEIGRTGRPAQLHEEGGRITVTMAVRADGTLENVLLNRSSGDGELDRAVIAQVQRAAPFAPLPAEIRQQTDVLHITASFSFED